MTGDWHEPTKLSCGGKGPCCHVGYSHRHCEHCDEVINTWEPNDVPLQLYKLREPLAPAWWRQTWSKATTATTNPYELVTHTCEVNP